MSEPRTRFLEPNFGQVEPVAEAYALIILTLDPLHSLPLGLSDAPHAGLRGSLVTPLGTQAACTPSAPSRSLDHPHSKGRRLWPWQNTARPARQSIARLSVI